MTSIPVSLAVPAGWHLLEHGERLQPGDQIYIHGDLVLRWQLIKPDLPKYPLVNRGCIDAIRPVEIAPKLETEKPTNG